MQAQLEQVGEGPSSYANANQNYGTTASPGPMQGQNTGSSSFGGVDFQKGCYPGQEVVARSQYRGTTKRRTFLFESEVVASPGQDVFIAGAEGEPAGTVANAAPSPEGGGSALIELRLAALGGGELRLGSGDGPALRRAALPYPVAIDAEATA